MILKDSLEKKLREINLVIKKKHTESQDVGLFTGLSGLALFQFYYAKYLDNDKIADDGLETISLCIKKVNSGYSYPTYCDGIAGMGWTMQHLKKEGFLDDDCEELLSYFDDYLHNQMTFEFGRSNYDFFHGALGYAFYFLSRYKYTDDSNLKKRYASFLYDSIKSLKELSISDGNFIKWESTLDRRKNNKVYNLGLSHGMASILNFLGRLYRFQEFKKSTEELINRGIGYLISFEENTKGLSHFPAYIEKNIPAEYKSRLAWCYGDLGIGLSLLQIGASLGDIYLEKRALRILKSSTKRKTKNETSVIDSGICHGSYGNALIYERVFQKTNNPLFKKSSKFWMVDGLQKAIHKDGYAGYKQWNPPAQNWAPQLSLLEGIGGIGLVIIDYLSEDSNTWDECLMIS
ncbi:lanthionine synthetase LanC family protein [Ulvibacterium sp.]|uniref:lanthionine synthetase LanC family protein n=1 Tax=Ulvibacterium sp. TaxID=2665914 RepID=UPI0026310193|nr:lanthionine synthetase LanC family protein [Ulvibacterium sp.]